MYGTNTNNATFVFIPSIGGFTAVLPSVTPSVGISSGGLAIGPNFGFLAPNPTLWAVAGGTYWYYDGFIFVNTNHSTGNAFAVNPGGSANYIYNYVGNTGEVYKYNGTGTSTLVTTLTVNAVTSTADVVGDDLDNFYLLRNFARRHYTFTILLECSPALILLVAWLRLEEGKV